MEEFPAEDVEACVSDSLLQRRQENGPSDAERDTLAKRRTIAIERGAPDSAEWIWFSSPEWTWRSECGSEGWLLYERKTGKQHAFVMTAMN